MTKDGRETQWRQITEHDKPELVALPDGLDDKYVLKLKRTFVTLAKCERVNNHSLSLHCELLLPFILDLTVLMISFVSTKCDECCYREFSLSRNKNLNRKPFNGDMIEDK